MKKTLAFVLSIAIVFTMSASSFAVTLDKSSSNFTKYSGLSNYEIQQRFLENIEVIEHYIENQGTTVLQELSREKIGLRKF